MQNLFRVGYSTKFNPETGHISRGIGLPAVELSLIHIYQVLRQARQAADGYLKGSRAWDRRLGRFAGLAGPFWGAAGALLASGVWCAWLFL